MQYLLNIGTIVRHHNLAKYKVHNIDDVNYVHIKANQYKGNGLKRIIYMN